MERKAFIALVLFVPLIVLASSPQALRDVASLLGANKAVATEAGSATSRASKGDDEGGTPSVDSQADARATDIENGNELVLMGEKVDADGVRSRVYRDPNVPADPTSAAAARNDGPIVYERGRPVTGQELDARKAACSAHATMAAGPPAADADATTVVNWQSQLDQLYAHCIGEA